MSKASLVFDADPVVAVSVYASPGLLIVRLLNVATPEIVFLVSVPPRVPALGFVPIATVTLSPDLGLPKASRTVTWTPVVSLMVVLFSVSVGCWLKIVGGTLAALGATVNVSGVPLSVLAEMLPSVMVSCFVSAL